MIHELLADDNISAAMKHILEGNTKIDTLGMEIAELPNYWYIHSESISEALLKGEYAPHTVYFRTVLNPNGKERRIARYAAVDMLLLRAIHQLLSPMFEADVSDSCYAYRPGVSAADAIKSARRIAESGFSYAVKLDIEDYFGSVPRSLLLELLAPYAGEELLSLIQAFLNAGCYDEDTGAVVSVKDGLFLGSPLSPLLANFYLLRLDKQLYEDDVPFVRYSDDITLFAKTKGAAKQLLEKYTRYIDEQMCLRLNSNKCEISPINGLKLLGYQFSVVKNHVEAVRRNSSANHIRTEDWTPVPLLASDDPLIFLKSGILGRKHMAILYEGEQFKRIFPSINLHEIHVHANVTLTPGFLSFAAKQNLRICYYNAYGHYLGAFLPAESNTGNQCMLAQAKCYLTPRYRLTLAKKLEEAAVFNLYQNVRYYRERKNPLLIAAETEIHNSLKELHSAATIEELLLVEVRARQTYYHALPLIITNPYFRFTERSLRPPRDAINALISFGNTLLYQLVADDIYASRLDIRISFVHSASGERNENLHLDIADVLKPILVDRVIFSVVNRREITGDMFTTADNGGVYLNHEGKRVFLHRFRHKLAQVITHQDEKKTYRKLISDEINALRSHFETGAAYHPYRYR